jgi:hypothetical protein
VKTSQTASSTQLYTVAAGGTGLRQITTIAASDAATNGTLVYVQHGDIHSRAIAP